MRDQRGVEAELIVELDGLLRPLPATVPGRRKGREGGEPAKVQEEGGQEQEQNFGQRQKTALAARLSSVGGRGRSQATGGGRQGGSREEGLSAGQLEKVLVVPISEGNGEMPGLAGEEVGSSCFYSFYSYSYSYFCSYSSYSSSSYSYSSYSSSSQTVLSKSREATPYPAPSQQRVRMNLSGLEEGSLTSASGEVQEKRTRCCDCFCLLLLLLLLLQLQVQSLS